MAVDFKPHFAKYRAVVSLIDGIFEKVKKEYPKEVFCREKCSDCCYAIFDLTIIEAIHLNHQFNLKFSGTEKYELIQQASKADRALNKLKRDAYKEIKSGKNEMEILAKMAQERVRCPLLGPDNLCIMYESRPITCRIYGIPTSSAGMTHICGRTNFKEGGKYPTLNMDKIYAQLQLISAEMIKEIRSKNIKMHEMLIPVSMALITEYNDDYLGVDSNDGE
ncbi:MAG: YkgJ family cysteine cluster protein [Desulfobacteraceae bacterium]|nr:MAG: YkgJ family cysteine cluster protein [Desulfobacteraceae bacterium]